MRKSAKKILICATALTMLLTATACGQTGSGATAVKTKGAVTEVSAPPTEQEIYDAFSQLQSGADADKTAELRATMYSGLETMDWDAYRRLGGGDPASEETRDKYESTGFALLDYLAAQEYLSEDELTWLQRGVLNHGIDGAYAEEYSTALANALENYPVFFCESLAYQSDRENMETYVIGDAVYGTYPESSISARLETMKKIVDSGYLDGDALAVGQAVVNKLENPVS
ncbi:MAG: hypothetical protein VB112_06715 [Oscillospiraceae bacterium]|nr:hypothetical protein [Oscillospiraceae bacterium]